MTVNDLREKLKAYNQNAELEVVVANYAKPFEITFGGADGCTKESCTDVCFMVGSSSEIAALPTPEAAGRDDEQEDLARAVASVLPFLNELRAVVYRKVAPLCHHALRNYTMEQVKALRCAPPSGNQAAVSEPKD